MRARRATKHNKNHNEENTDHADNAATERERSRRDRESATGRALKIGGGLFLKLEGFEGGGRSRYLDEFDTRTITAHRMSFISGPTRYPQTVQ